MILYLCEKPSQGRDIGRVLGATFRRDGYVEGMGVRVTWCIGHLLEMTEPDRYKPEWKQWRLDTLPMVPEEWKLELTRRGGKQFKIINDLLKGANEVILATDADREGETIGREILERCRYRGKISRLWLSALDDASIRKAIASLWPGQKTEPLYQAGLGRSRADWLVGMNLTRAYTIIGRQGGYNGVLSVGRVQTPTLKLVVDRDRLIENFKPVDHFDVIALLRVANGEFKAKWVPSNKHADDEGRCLDRTIAEMVAQKVQGQIGKITKAETKRVNEPPPLPLELSTLQQEASRRWNMSAKRTLEIAQSLYEKHKAVTYPRTDCRFLPTEQFKDAQKVLQAIADSDPGIAPLVHVANPKTRSKAWNDKKIKAHHAIIPTAAKVKVDGLNREESYVYDLIRRHFLAQFFPPHEYDATIIDTLVNSETFRATGRVEQAPGWKRALGQTRKEKDSENGEDDQSLPHVQTGEDASLEKTELIAKQTKPPNRYTEGTLIQAMKSVGKLVEDPRLRKILRDTSGIGTEATRAAIIETLIKRGLLAKEGKKNLVSMPAGRALVDALPHSVTDPATTAVWEQILDDIANGSGSLDEFLNKSELWLNKLIGNVKKRQELGINPFKNLPDPSISGTDHGRPGRSPPKGADQQSAALPDPSQTCPDCGKLMVRRKSKRGSFWGCSTYPTCSTTVPDNQGNPGPREDRDGGINGRCPLCKTGWLVERRARRGVKAGSHFSGCSNFPECHYSRPHAD
ncbi:MAG: DNA topoisomerase 3 [Magnetococcales bacterium]|nr:DNA topoisomerase 3 [Magnetococcales bacterium]MBF0151263.1 DNA topoisomerase 3 [Magnetococcales bacterium]